MEELINRLQYYNDWRRGLHDEQPTPTQIGLDIDAAIRLLKEYQEINKS